MVILIFMGRRSRLRPHTSAGRPGADAALRRRHVAPGHVLPGRHQRPKGRAGVDDGRRRGAGRDVLGVGDRPGAGRVRAGLPGRPRPDLLLLALHGPAASEVIWTASGEPPRGSAHAWARMRGHSAGARPGSLIGRTSRKHGAPARE